jgi:hypothetical protein
MGVSGHPLWNYMAARTRGKQSEFATGEICGSNDSDYEGYFWRTLSCRWGQQVRRNPRDQLLYTVHFYCRVLYHLVEIQIWNATILTQRKPRNADGRQSGAATLEECYEWGTVTVLLGVNALNCCRNKVYSPPMLPHQVYSWHAYMLAKTSFRQNSHERNRCNASSYYSPQFSFIFPRLKNKTK